MKQVPEEQIAAPVPGPEYRALAMRVARPGATLQPEQVHFGALQAHQVLIRVAACGVCRTDLHLLDGELGMARHPVTPGHEIVGRVRAVGAAVGEFAVGDRVGVPWLGGTCGQCRYCQRGQENLCEQPAFTGVTIDGGYAELAVAVKLHPMVEAFALRDAGEAIQRLRQGKVHGAAVLVCGDDPK